MNRQERRSRERKIQKELQVLDKMSEKDVKKVYEIIEKTCQSRNQQMIEAIDRNLTAVLIDEDYSLDEINELMNKLSVYLNEDILKNKEIEKGNIEMKNVDVKVKEYMKKLMDSGRMKKEIIDDTVCKFPTLSKTMVTNAYARVKEEYMKEPAEPKKEVKKEVKEVVKAVEIKEEVKEEKVISKFKVKRVELEGEYGNYIKEGDKVVAGEVTFNNLKELEEYKRKEIELFNLKMKEIEDVYKAEVR